MTHLKINFFEWWYTNSDGVDYMNLIGCSINDLPLVILIGVLSLSTFVQYADISLHHFKIAKKYPNSNTKKYLIGFICVFILCGSRDLYRILSIWVNPYKLLLLILLVLNIATYYFRTFMRRTNIINDMFLREQWAESQLKNLESEVVKKIQKAFHSESGKIIKYEDLKQLNEGEWYEDNGIKYMPIDLKSEILHFRTVADEDSWFNWHGHDCWEMFRVREGEMLDNRDCNVYSVGDFRVYKPYEKHDPGSKIGADIDVFFSLKPFNDV